MKLSRFITEHMDEILRARIPADIGTVCAGSVEDAKASHLGLFVGPEIAIGHDGSIGVKSDGVDGSTFTVRLPLAGVARGGD